ncbi:MAG: hypothetical protein HWE22_01930 [Flavobacteriales bacterium]|nr:hypothetical protein [Flavobacteriales bacterium]
MQESIIDHQARRECTTPMKMVQWWEKKRYLYNIILVVFIVFTLFSLSDYLGFILSLPEAIIQGIGFVIFGNIFYTFGWATGVLRHYYSSGDSLSNTSRWTLFTLGCLFSFVVIHFHYILALDVIFAD